MFNRTLQVRLWYFRFERIHDEAAALEAWRQLVVAQGWSPVGEPEIGSDGADPFVIGKIVQHPGLQVDPSASQVLLPA